MLSRVYFFLSAQKRRRVKHPLSDSLAALLRHETQKLIDENPELLAARQTGRPTRPNSRASVVRIRQSALQPVMVHFGNHLLDHLSGANVFNIFHTIGSAGGLYSLLAPYFVAFSQFTMGRDLGMRISRRFGQPDANAANAS
jgi:hypothetical protein